MGAGAGIIFKGSGFYETDYKEKKGTPPSDKQKETTKSDSNGGGASKDGAKESTKAKPGASESKTSAKSKD